MSDFSIEVSLELVGVELIEREETITGDNIVIEKPLLLLFEVHNDNGKIVLTRWFQTPDDSMEIKFKCVISADGDDICDEEIEIKDGANIKVACFQILESLRDSATSRVKAYIEAHPDD